MVYYILTGALLFSFLYFEYSIFSNPNNTKGKIFFKTLFNSTVTLIAIFVVGLFTGEVTRTEKVDPKKYEVVQQKEYVLFAFPDRTEKRRRDGNYYIWKHAEDTSKVWFEQTYVKTKHGDIISLTPTLETKQPE